VFKSADTPWRRARGALAAMLQPDLFREGIDGEAVAWAMRRLQAHEAQRRVLMVFSDGSPMDSATNLANAAQYLDRHLMEVVAHHERSGAEIYGVGVGLDLSLYFSRSHVLDLSRALSMGTLREVRDMLGRGARR
jgi:cobaltochelatase CobT